MESVDLDVLRRTLAWQAAGMRVALITVLETYGSAPRRPGALLAIREDGLIAGSVSGGCVEAELIERLCSAWPVRIATLRFGGRADAHRLKLPCGGVLELLVEPAPDPGILCTLLTTIERRALLVREVDVPGGMVRLLSAEGRPEVAWDGRTLAILHGPVWRLVIIGAGQTSRYLAQMAQALDYDVVVCDPREEYATGWDVPGATLDRGMPDDVVQALKPDARTAVLALTHDPKLDDLALLEALVSDAFYVGALGSAANQVKRRARLRDMELPDVAIARLHGPVGLPIGSRTPPEIAVSILAELTALRHCAAQAGVRANSEPMTCG